MTDQFDWTEYLRLARQLAHSVDDEAALRTAISRVYYCVYHRATEACRVGLDMTMRGHRIWDQIEAYGSSNDQPQLRLIGERGNDLKRRRIIADYCNPYNRDNRQLPPIAQLAANAIDRAEATLRMIDQFERATHPGSDANPGSAQSSK